jgi:hypothetical protein
MANFTIRRLRDSQQEKLRWSPQATTTTLPVLKPSDYRDDGQVQAISPYQAWQLLRERGEDLRIGDVLVDENGATVICRYSGFEEAEWLVVAPDGSQMTAPGNEMEGNSAP